MRRDDIRQKLIQGTIHIIATEGLDSVTTKKIGTETATNEVYIYRCCGSKDGLFVKVFDYLDGEFYDKTMEHVSVMYMADLEYKVRCHIFFSEVWDFLLSHKEKCLAYIRYYYSPYFTKYSYEAHKARFMPLVKKFSDAFIDEADVWMILNHILNVMLDFAIKVHNGQMPDSEAYSEHVFRVIYESVKQYFRPSSPLPCTTECEPGI